MMHRYRSEIHGNYRVAGCRCGVMVGVLMLAYILVRLMMGRMAPSPTSYATDGILLVMEVLLTAYYRNAVEGKRITLKEGMLFGLWTAGIGAVVYAVGIGIVTLTWREQSEYFAWNCMGRRIDGGETEGYWSAWWAIVSLVNTVVLGGFGAFVAALFFRNEKARTRAWRGRRDDEEMTER